MISFIVPAYNEELCLAGTLDALHAAGVGLNEKYEIIVADDASDDGTAAIAQDKGAVLVSVDHRKIAATRNSGARQASGDYFIFVDADTIVNEMVVRYAVLAMREGAVGGGAAIQFDEPVPRSARVLLRAVVRLFRALGLAAGCFLFCTRGAFYAAGGFDERFYGAEEIIMSRALKRQGKFVVLSQMVVTSARKLRTYSAREILFLMVRMMLRGPSALKRRKGTEFWYTRRREAPRDDA
jgi:glycosyltransferase involved in cell wall biosynthesis